MSNPTTPFSWQMPTSTDLVTDLPADFEVFGQAVATSMADLLGGTTGQILSKTTNADMDFTWIANDQGDITGVTAGTGISGGGTSGTVTVTNSMATAIDAKGDLIAGTGADAFSRLGVGANNTVLTADSAEATGLKWAAAAAPTPSGYTLLNSGGTALSGSSTVTISGISNIDSLLIYTTNASSSASQGYGVRLNGDTGFKYNMAGIETNAASTTGWNGITSDNIDCGAFSNNAGSVGYVACQVDFAASTSFKKITLFSMSTGGGGSGQFGHTGGGFYNSTAAITSVSMICSANFDAGSVFVYGKSA